MAKFEPSDRSAQQIEDLKEALRVLQVGDILDYVTAAKVAAINGPPSTLLYRLGRARKEITNFDATYLFRTVPAVGVERIPCALVIHLVDEKRRRAQGAVRRGIKIGRATRPALGGEVGRIVDAQIAGLGAIRGMLNARKFK